MIDSALNINGLGFILAACVGAIAHWLKVYKYGQTTLHVWDWFGPQNWASTLYSFIAFIAALIGGVATGVVNEQMSIWAAIYSGFTTGFAVDSIATSGSDDEKPQQ